MKNIRTKICLFGMCILSINQSARADMVMPTPICNNHNWVEVYIIKNTAAKNARPINRPVQSCILPDGKIYDAWTLEREKDGKYAKLITIYSGKRPTVEQINTVKKKLEADGYRIDE